MILILEDDPARVKKFKRFLLNETVLVVETVPVFRTAFQDLSQQGKLDGVCLDHDLVESHYGIYMSADDDVYRAAMEGLTPEAGFHAAQWMAEQARVPTLIHTRNPAGQEAMRKFLPHAIALDFARLEIIMERADYGTWETMQQTVKDFRARIA